MSYDLAVWEGPTPRSDEQAAQVFTELSKRYSDRADPTDESPAILAYVDALLARWPDITSDHGPEHSPWSDGPLAHNATGPLLYFGMVPSRAEQACEFAAQLAQEHDLVCFDPQTMKLRRPDLRHPGPLPNAIHTAIDAGATAATATRQLAMRNTGPADSGSVIRQFLNGQLFAVPGPWVTPSQVQKACEALDEFTTSLEDLNRHIQQPDAHIDTMADASARLWESNEEAAPVHNEVNATLAVLGRYRINIILKRPLLAKN